MTVGKEIARDIVLNHGRYGQGPPYFAVYRYNNVFNNAEAFLLAYNEHDAERAAAGGHCPNLTKLWSREGGLTLAGTLAFK